MRIRECETKKISKLVIQYQGINTFI